MKADVLRALLRFHLSVGTRLALRRLAPISAVGVALFYLLRPDFFILLVTEADRTGGLFLGAVIFLICVIFAALAAPRVFLGLKGWIKHLPVPSQVQRLTAQAGVLISLLPVLLGIGLLYLASGSTRPISWVMFLCGLPLSGWAAGQMLLQVKRRWLVRTLALAAGVTAASARGLYLTLAVFFLVAAEMAAGQLVSGKKPLPALTRDKTRILSWFILWRALRWRMLAAYLFSLIPFVLTYAYVSNNIITSLQRQRAYLFGTAVAVVVFAAVAAHLAARRRPAWPWTRCLPQSSRTRLIHDAFFLGLHGITLLIPLLWLGTWVCLLLIPFLPALFVYAAAVIRRAPELRMPILGLVLLNGTLGGMLVAVLPWTSLGFLPLLPVLLRYGETLEQEQKVSRWLEFHHLAAGDPHSWSIE